MHHQRADDRLAAAAHLLQLRRRIPSATYRLQFGSAFTFNDARRIVPYLASLGISHVYASPILRAGPGGHGYDICDHSTLDPSLGTDADFDAFVDALNAHGMGLILDVVPNHMGIATECNRWWMDVLENGPSSPYARFFDIDWHPATAAFRDKVLLPILEDQYGRVLEAGLLRLVFGDGGFRIRYHDRTLPVAPRTWTLVLALHLDGLLQGPGAGDPHVLELQSIITAIGHLPPATETDPGLIAEGRREADVIRRRVADVYAASAAVREAVDRAISDINGRAGEPASFERLDALLDAQAYRPAYWRVASEEINYRRFFDVNELAAIRVELPEVFDATHAFTLQLLADGKAGGVRIDHPDGLRNPAGYFHRLQDAYVAAIARTAGAGDADPAALRALAGGGLPLYAVAEKILSEGETLDETWQVHGTTGYDFLNAANGIFVDSRHRRAFGRLYAQFTGRDINFRELENSAKKMIMLVSFASEVNLLAHELDRISSRHRWYRDFTRNSLVFALREIIACLPVYRTYETAPGAPAAHRDRRYVEAAVAEAKRRNPRTAESLFDFIRDTLLFDNIDTFRPEDRPRVVDFALSFQQLTAPVMAKGVEDTAFYVYNRLVSLNEVGGNPSRFGTPLAAFHRANVATCRRWPHTLTASSTHDTKRSEDVRARINVLSEMPVEWRAAVARWSAQNRPLKTVVDGQPAPDANDEYLLYQTLVGAWPVRGPQDGFAGRILQYMRKATKEAKVHTSWVNANEGYDRAVEEFVRDALGDALQTDFARDIAAFAATVAWYGALNSLSALLLKVAAPGVPDTYQGTDLYDFSLVDPDNRRPVDYDERQRLLLQLDQREQDGLPALAEDLRRDMEQPAAKLFVLSRALRFRARNLDLFQRGEYVPLFATGSRAAHVVGFARRHGRAWTIAAAPRLVRGICPLPMDRIPPEAWGGAALRLPRGAPDAWVDAFSGEQVSSSRERGPRALYARDLFARFPLALLRPA